jgi:hypothetical protein
MAEVRVEPSASICHMFGVRQHTTPILIRSVREYNFFWTGGRSSDKEICSDFLIKRKPQAAHA